MRVILTDQHYDEKKKKFSRSIGMYRQQHKLLTVCVFIIKMEGGKKGLLGGR